METTNGQANWAPGTNGNGKHEETTLNEREMRVKELIANSLWRREEFLRQWSEPKRDIHKACGYPLPGTYTAREYKALYDADPIAARIVELWPIECAQVTPKVYESEDNTEATEFEQAWDSISRDLRGTKSYYQDEEGNLIWKYVLQADILSRIGSFGILLLGFNDGKMMDQPAPNCPPDGFAMDISGATNPTSWNPSNDTARDNNAPQNINNLPPLQDDPLGPPKPAKPPWEVEKEKTEKFGKTYERQMYDILGTDAMYYQSPTSTPLGGQLGSIGGQGQKRKLLWMKAYDESLVQVISWEGDLRNPRWNQPLYYNVTLVDPRQPHTGVGRVANTIRVHWSRIIHVADTDKKAVPDDIFAQPAMQTSLNRVLDIRKILGASGESFWLACFMGISIESNPQLGGDVKYDRAGLSKQIKEWEEGMSRWLALTGFTAKTLSPQVVDPTPAINAQLQQICIHEACPQRVFMGSERGELASSQDDSKWNDRVMRRNKMYVTPCIIVPLIDRLIQVGVLPKPKGYSIWWPDLESTSAQVKATISSQITACLSQFANGGISTIFSFQDFLTRVMGFTEEEAESIQTNAERDIEDQGISAMALRGAGGLGGILALLGQYAQGQVTRDQAMEIFSMVLGVDEDKADRLVPENPPQPQQPQFAGQPQDPNSQPADGVVPQNQPQNGQQPVSSSILPPMLLDLKNAGAAPGLVTAE